MSLEEGMKLLWVAVYEKGDENHKLVYAGPLDRAPDAVQRAFAIDSTCDSPAKVAAMWFARHVIQLPPYLVVVDSADGVDVGDLLQALNLEKTKHPLEGYVESLLREEKDA
ncbi:hypothetical protein MN1_430 [Thermus phage MN1]|nr:hypothetical protein MN1_430 [Thermus phage MN1]